MKPLSRAVGLVAIGLFNVVYLSAQTSFGIIYETRHYFRGVPEVGIENAMTLATNLSSGGFSGGVTWSNLIQDERAAATAFLGYHYALGGMDVGGGFSGNWSQNDRRDDPVEAYFEITAGPLRGGVVPSFTYSYRLWGGLNNYGELKLTRPFTTKTGNWGFAAYTLLAFGDFHSASYTFDHAEVGVNGSWQIAQDWVLGLGGGAVVPMHGTQQVTRSSAAEWRTSISIQRGAHRARRPADTWPQTFPSVQWRTSFETSRFFRGVERIGRLPVIGSAFEYSALGWSGGLTWFNVLDRDVAEATAFFGYHYPLGPLDLGVGLAADWAQRDGRTDPGEAYAEIAADPVFLGITPSFRYSVRFDGIRRQYGELGLVRNFKVAKVDAELAPFVTFGFGDFYSHNYSMNHVEVGLRSGWPINDNWRFSWTGGAEIPLSAVREFTGHSQTRWFVSAAISLFSGK